MSSRYFFFESGELVLFYDGDQLVADDVVQHVVPLEDEQQRLGHCRLQARGGRSQPRRAARRSC